MSRLWQTQKSHLTININSVHKGIKYKCDQCDKEFTTSAHRYVHIKSVHEHKKYPCTLNDYQAPQQQNLTKHRKSVYEGVHVSMSIHVQFVGTKQHYNVILLNIFSQNIKERNISVVFVIRNTNLHQISEETLYIQL